MHPHDPLARLAADRERARALRDPWASLCVLSTVTDGAPESRVLVLRDVAERLAIFVNATSPKQRYLASARDVAVLIYLASCGVQYRLAATPERIDNEVVRSSWRERPRIPKVMDWVYTRRAPQSDVVGSRAELQAWYDQMDAALGEAPDAPSTAIGYFLRPRVIERLELATDAIHARERYALESGAWRLETLIP